MAVTHSKTLTGPDGVNPDRAQPSDWNDDHDVDLSDYAGPDLPGTAIPADHGGSTHAATQAAAEATAAAANTADIAAHAAITDAHHAKYTDAEAVTAVEAEADLELQDVQADAVEVGDAQSDVSKPLTIARDVNGGHELLGAYFAYDSAYGPRIALYKARGGHGSPTTVSDYDTVGYLTGYGYDGSAFRAASAVNFSMAAGVGGASDFPSRIYFQTTPQSSGSMRNIAYFDSDGSLIPATDSTHALGATSKRWSTVYTDAINFGDSDLDHFSTGTWTPVLTAQTPGDLSVAYSTQSGRYTRIGNLVTAEFTIVTSTYTHSTASGTLRVAGLPFTPANADVTGSCVVGNLNTSAVAVNVVPVTVVSTYFYFLQTRDSATPLGLYVTDGTSGSSISIKGTITYTV